VKQSLERVLTEPCPYCSGTGVDQVDVDDLLRNPERGEEGGPDLNGHRLLLRVNPISRVR
jgi:hypothetical protein